MLKAATWARKNVALSDYYQEDYARIPTSDSSLHSGTWTAHNPKRWLWGGLKTFGVTGELLNEGVELIVDIAEEYLDGISNIGHPLGEYQGTYPVLRPTGQWGYIYETTFSIRKPPGAYDD